MVGLLGPHTVSSWWFPLVYIGGFVALLIVLSVIIGKGK